MYVAKPVLLLLHSNQRARLQSTTFPPATPATTEFLWARVSHTFTTAVTRITVHLRRWALCSAAVCRYITRYRGDERRRCYHYSTLVPRLAAIAITLVRVLALVRVLVRIHTCASVIIVIIVIVNIIFIVTVLRMIVVAIATLIEVIITTTRTFFRRVLTYSRPHR